MTYHHCCVANVVYLVTFVRTVPDSSNNPLYYTVCHTPYRTRHFFNK